MKDAGLLRRTLGPAGANGVWLVGGAVRDALLKRPSGDVDLAVAGDARAAAARLGRALGARPFPLDEERGTYRVISAQGGRRVTYDFTRLRGRTLADDLALRDFTINAMAAPLSSPAAIEDPCGGRADLVRRRVRLVGEKALTDDPLRLLRAFRFAAELDFTVEAKTLALVRRHRRKILRSAPERVREELFKIFATPRAAPALAAVDKAGLLDVVFPEAGPMRRTARDFYGAGGVLGHSIAAVAALEDILARLSFFFPRFHRPLLAHAGELLGGHPRLVFWKIGELLHDAGKPATARREGGEVHFHGHEHVGARLARAAAVRLRFSREEGRSVESLVRGHMRPGNLAHQPVITERAVYRFYRDLGGDAVGMLVAALGDHFTYLSKKGRETRKDKVYLAVRRMLGSYFLKREKVQPPRLLDGHVLMKGLGLKEGPFIGRLLEAIREAQAAGQVKTPAEALALARKFSAVPGEKRPA